MSLRFSNLNLIVSFVVCVAVTIFSVYFLDGHTAFWIENAPIPEIKYWAREITNVALAAFYLIPSLLLYIFSKWTFPALNFFKDRKDILDKLRIWSGFAFLSFASTGIVIQALKGIIGRQRPHLTETFETHNFDPFTLHWHWHSMPSGHSQVIFAAATILSLAFPKFRWIFFFFASIIAATRVIIHQHFLSDVILGSGISVLLTLLLYKKTKWSKQ